MLAKIASKLDAVELSNLMNISSNLANLNKERFDKFSVDPLSENSKQAAFAFAGDTYEGLSAEKINPENDIFFQNNIRILSGLYGLLRPFDVIQPYRLEMGSRLANQEGKNLYEFWNNTLAKRLKMELKDHEDASIINLASEEYFKVLKFDKEHLNVIHTKFFEIRNGNYKLISFYAKKARGLMARFIIENRISKPNDLKDFNLDDYNFQKELSKEDTYVFSRKSK